MDDNREKHLYHLDVKGATHGWKSRSLVAFARTKPPKGPGMKNSLSVACLALIGGVCVVGAQQMARSTSSGVFTADQAKNGERAYQSRCANCHGADLRSTDPEAPDLTEGIFKFGWKGKTIAETFEQIRSTMPLRNARSLDDQTYLDILAYILQFNGAPSGNQKLEPDLPILQQIVIEPPN